MILRHEQTLDINMTTDMGFNYFKRLNYKEFKMNYENLNEGALKKMFLCNSRVASMCGGVIKNNGKQFAKRYVQPKRIHAMSKYDHNFRVPWLRCPPVYRYNGECK